MTKAKPLYHDRISQDPKLMVGKPTAPTYRMSGTDGSAAGPERSGGGRGP